VGGVVKENLATKSISKLVHTVSTRLTSTAAARLCEQTDSKNPDSQVFSRYDENLVQNAWSTCCWLSVVRIMPQAGSV